MKILLDNNLPKVKISNTETVHCSLYNFQKKTDEGLFLNIFSKNKGKASKLL